MFLYFTMGAPFPKVAHSHGGSGLPSNTRFRRPIIQGHKPNGISIVSAGFAQMTAECPPTLLWDAHFPSQLPLPMGGSGPPSNTWFPGPTRVLNPNGISSVVVITQLTNVAIRPTDRTTDHATRSVTIDRTYVRSTCDAA